MGNRNSSKSSSRRGPPYLTFIITHKSERFNATVRELTTALPDFFNITRKKSVSHNDSRIPRHGDISVASLLLSHIDVWNAIGSKSDDELGENDWAFVFEDDVSVMDPGIMRSFYGKIYFAWNYARPNPILRKSIEEGFEFAQNDGILYFGTCGPIYVDNDTNSLYTRDGLVQLRRGIYYCTHAIAYTKWRARRFWSDLSAYKFLHNEVGSDTIARAWQSISKTYPLSFASNIHWPPDDEHYGFFYQDRGARSSIIQG